MAIVESIGSGVKAAGSLVKAAVWDSFPAKAVRFAASFVVGLSCALVAAAVIVPTIAALHLITAASTKIFKMPEGRIKTVSALLQGLYTGAKNGSVSFYKNFCLYGPLTLAGFATKSLKKFSAASGSGRTDKEDPHAAAIEKEYEDGKSLQSYDSQSVNDPDDYHNAQFSEDEKKQYDLWAAQLQQQQEAEALNAYQAYITAMSGASAPELQAPQAVQLKEAETRSEEIAKWREEQGWPPTKIPAPVSATGATRHGSALAI